jgi:hypothetical protein
MATFFEELDSYLATAIQEFTALYGSSELRYGSRYDRADRLYRLLPKALVGLERQRPRSNNPKLEGLIYALRLAKQTLTELDYTLIALLHGLAMREWLMALIADEITDRSALMSDSTFELPDPSDTMPIRDALDELLGPILDDLDNYLRTRQSELSTRIIEALQMLPMLSSDTDVLKARESLDAQIESLWIQAVVEGSIR